MSLEGISDESPVLILVIAIGLFEGALIGAMANVVPFQVVLLCAMMTSLLVWRAQKISFFVFFIMLGAVVGGGFGALSGIVPWGFTVFFAVNMVVYLWRTGASGAGGSLPSLIAVPFYIFISVALFYNSSYADFCIQGVNDVCANPSNWVHGFPTIWAGCVSTCSLSPLSILGSSIFSNFIQSLTSGNYVGLLQSLFPSTQSSLGGIIQWATVLVSFTIGLLLVLIGSGVGFSAQAIASGFGITINEAGTRFAQSFGIGLVMWSIIYGGFGGWLGAFGSGLGWGGVLTTSLTVFFATMVFYGLYVQGKNIGGTSG